MRLIAVALFTAGILSLIYYCIIIVYAGIRSEFSWFWLTFGTVSLAIGLYLHYDRLCYLNLNQNFKIVIMCLLTAGISVFAILEGSIICYANKKPESKADYMIVLGAKVRGSKVTNSLKKRLDAAILYLDNNRETLVIVSGGQGPGEDISEASAMKNYLICAGINQARIRTEEKSVNTNENIMFSHHMITNCSRISKKEKSKIKVVIVTNGFHIYRALHIAYRQNVPGVTSLAARSDSVLCVNYYVREFFAVIKDKLIGNII